MGRWLRTHVDSERAVPIVSEVRCVAGHQILIVAQAIADQLAPTIRIEARAGEGGRLFGSVTSSDVADGYARNFLVPRGLALRATSGIQKQADAMRRKGRSETPVMGAVSTRPGIVTSPIFRTVVGLDGMGGT